VEVLFLGDDMIHNWETTGEVTWKKYFEPMKAANFGHGGDQTGHLIWRLTDGNLLHGLNPKVAVLQIGTNNMGPFMAEDAAGAIEKIVEILRAKLPSTKLLVMGVFPQGIDPVHEHTLRDRIKAINQLIAKLDNGKTVRYMDISSRLLESDGSLSPEVSPNFFHISAKGYEIWADAIHETVKQMLRNP
jgi:lysophospholipase L1-like esterase